MAILSWGRPLVEIKPSVNGSPVSGAPWVALPVIKQNTAKLSITKGEKREALGEGGEVVDTRTDRNKYSFECEIFLKKGDVRIIGDDDGVVHTNYALRLTPEDPTNEGFLLESTSVSVEESWSSEEGFILKYTFDALQPMRGRIMKPYQASNLEVTPGELFFTAEADSSGKKLTVSASGSVSAVSSETWAVVSVSGKVVTVTVSKNGTGGARSSVVTVTADELVAQVAVTQIP